MASAPEPDLETLPSLHRAAARRFRLSVHPVRARASGQVAVLAPPSSAQWVSSCPCFPDVGVASSAFFTEVIPVRREQADDPAGFCQTFPSLACTVCVPTSRAWACLFPRCLERRGDDFFASLIEMQSQCRVFSYLYAFGLFSCKDFSLCFHNF